MEKIAPHTKHGRFTLLAVVAAFLLPILIAWLLTSGVLPWMPKGRLNYGRVLEPTVSLQEMRFTGASGSEASLERRYGEWTMATIAGEPCEEHCRRNLEDMKRVHLAMREQTDRVRRIVLLGNGREEPALVEMLERLHIDYYFTDVQTLSQRLQSVQAVTDAEGIQDRIIFIDYASRAMMIYQPAAELGGVTKDLKRLLQASRTN